MAQISTYRDLLMPALSSLRTYAAPSVKHVEIGQNFLEDTIELSVIYTLFTRHELEDGSYKLNFKNRIGKMLLSDSMPNGRALVVERRSFLARAARVRKNKPKKIKTDH